MRRMAILTVVIFLAACQTASYEGNEGSPYYKVPIGSKLILRQDIVIPPHAAGIYLQGGKIAPLAQVNQYYPHCKFEVLKLKDTPQTIQPDEFSIKKVVQETTHSVGLDRLQSAAVSIGVGIHIGMDDDHSTLMTYVTRLDLHSEKQPDVFRLSCGLWAYPPQGQHVTIREIRQVLGNVFTLGLEN